MQWELLAKLWWKEFQLAINNTARPPSAVYNRNLWWPRHTFRTSIKTDTRCGQRVWTQRTTKPCSGKFLLASSPVAVLQSPKKTHENMEKCYSREHSWTTANPHPTRTTKSTWSELSQGNWNTIYRLDLCKNEFFQPENISSPKVSSSYAKNSSPYFIKANTHPVLSRQAKESTRIVYCIMMAISLQ